MNVNEGSVSPPTFHYGQKVMFNGHEYFVQDMCYERRHGEWYHKIKRGVPVGSCTDGTGIETCIVADNELNEMVR